MECLSYHGDMEMEVKVGKGGMACRGQLPNSLHFHPLVLRTAAQWVMEFHMRPANGKLISSVDERWSFPDTSTDKFLVEEN